MSTEMKNKFYTSSPAGRAYKKHLDTFGVAPKHYRRHNPRADGLAKAYLKAIKDGVPYNEKASMTPEERRYNY